MKEYEGAGYREPEEDETEEDYNTLTEEHCRRYVAEVVRQWRAGTGATH
jgi:hypothetical protein